MLEIVVLGFAILALVVPVFGMVGTLAEARGVVDVIATDTAAWFARHGEIPAGIDDDVAVHVEVREGVVHASASTRVSLLGEAGPAVTVTSHAAMAISPYRSGR